jgi:hypothetical protein
MQGFFISLLLLLQGAIAPAGEIKLPERKEIRGRITVEGGGPLPRLSMNWSYGPGRNPRGTPIEPQADGTFKIALYPGSHSNTSFELP